MGIFSKVREHHLPSASEATAASVYNIQANEIKIEAEMIYSIKADIIKAVERGLFTADIPMGFYKRVSNCYNTHIKDIIKDLKAMGYEVEFTDDDYIKLKWGLKYNKS